MEVDIPVLEGYLNIPTQSGFSLNRISKKKSSNQKYCQLFKASRHGIERLEICESKEDTKNPKIITLENCVKITQEPSSSNCISIVTKTGTLTLNALNEDDLRKWVNSLQGVAFKEKILSLPRNTAIEEDNDLYCSSYADGLFAVELIPSDASKRCKLESDTYILHLTTTELQLKSRHDGNAIVAKWPYRFIRKYGYRDNRFTFEAGRKCETGEGSFSLEHEDPKVVFRCMSTKMKSMKKILSGENLLDSSEFPMNLARSMEAGSRNPLPLSPSTDIDSTQSSMAMGYFLSNDSLNNISSSSIVSIPPSRSIPSKPPRKVLPNSTNNLTNENGDESRGSKLAVHRAQGSKDVDENSSKFTNECSSNKSITIIIPSIEVKDVPPELPIRNESRNGVHDDTNYECINNVTEAWKRLGIDEVNHNENIGDQVDDLKSFNWQRTQSQRYASQTVIVNQEGISPSKMELADEESDEGEYEHLNHFGPNSKKISSGYKTVMKALPSNYRKQFSHPVSSNDYEIIGNPDIQTCRLADDSHLGYGVLRKPGYPVTTGNNTGSSIITTVVNSIPNSPTNEVIINDLDHHKYNGLDYAIVSKPKRV